MREILVDYVGLCPTCSTLLVFTDYVGGTWRCTSCGKSITPLAFGYSLVDGEAARMRWIDWTGGWTSHRPEVDFVLGELSVYHHAPMSFRTLDRQAAAMPAPEPACAA